VAGAASACQTAETAGASGAGGGTAGGGTGSGLNINPQDYDYRKNSIQDFTAAKLFSDLNLGPFTIHNRMVKSAAFQLAFLRNNPDEYIGYYERMAKGGVEMIWVEYNNNIWPV